MSEKEQKQQNNMMKTTVGVTVGEIVDAASTTKDVDQSLIEVYGNTGCVVSNDGFKIRNISA